MEDTYDLSEDFDADEKVRNVLRTFQRYEIGFTNVTEHGKRKLRRPHVEAGAMMLKNGETINGLNKRKIGKIDGVRVGQHFGSLEEMAVIGLYLQPHAGIDFIQPGDGDNKYRFPICASLAAKNNYEDGIHEDGSDILIYTSKGGKTSLGNQAALNSEVIGNEVRVFRRHDYDKSTFSKTYRYHGLYHVESHTEEMGKGGEVLKFCFKRLAGQPDVKYSKPRSKEGETFRRRSLPADMRSLLSMSPIKEEDLFWEPRPAAKDASVHCRLRRLSDPQARLPTCESDPPVLSLPPEIKLMMEKKRALQSCFEDLGELKISGHIADDLREGRLVTSAQLTKVTLAIEKFTEDSDAFKRSLGIPRRE